MAKTKEGYGRNAKIAEHICSHKDQPLYANGLCGKCYHTQWMREHYKHNRKPEMYYFKQRLDTKFKISVEQYERMLVERGAVCEICGRLPGNRRLAVDHNHKTNKIRGLLCGPCNTLLSHVEHESEFSKAALKYLERHADNT
jgi:hypothetical protein